MDYPWNNTLSRRMKVCKESTLKENFINQIQMNLLNFSKIDKIKSDVFPLSHDEPLNGDGIKFSF